MAAVKICLLVAIIHSTVVFQIGGARQFASQLNSRNITHSTVVLEWLAPDDVTHSSNYQLTLFDDSSRVVRNRFIDNSSQTDLQFTGLDVWTNYTVRLITYNVQNEVLGTEWHSFSTRFFILNAKTLTAIAALLFISLCYIVALILNFTYNFDEDDGKWRRKIIDEYEQKRREKKARMDRYQRKKNYSIKRQFSSLLLWRKREASTSSDDTGKENASLENGYQDTNATTGTNGVLNLHEVDLQSHNNGEETVVKVSASQTGGIDEIDKISVASDEYINATLHSNGNESRTSSELNVTPQSEARELKEELVEGDAVRETGVE